MLKFIFLVVITCSLASGSAIRPFVVGGNDAKPGQFPYMISLRGINTPNFHGCGGGILNRRWFLSAAHCFGGMRAEEVLAVVGSVTLSGGTVYNCDRLINHPRFIPNIFPIYMSNWYDIAVLRTNRDIIFSPLVQPIPLNRRHLLSGVSATLAGFGASDPTLDIDNPGALDNLTMSEHLQFLNTRTITYNECNMRTVLTIFRYPNHIAHPTIHPTSHLCTVQPRGQGACFGDSGSMLISDGQIIGVAASGIKLCAQSSLAPDIYTRVSTFVPWIESLINDFD